MKKHEVKRTYDLYANIYDLVFGAVFESGRKEAVQTLPTDKELKILEIGVGTGLSLPYYNAGTEVTGIDLSPAMLKKAAQRSVRAKVHLLEMDAENLQMNSAQFDAALAMYVATVAPNPEALIKEMFRVTRPGGKIIFVSHFSKRGHWTAALEWCISPMSRLLGWRPLFYLEDFLALIAAADIEVSPSGLFGYWTIVEITRP